MAYLLVAQKRGQVHLSYVNNPLDYDLRMATRSEGAANPYWLPGGYTFNTRGGLGLPEMVTNPLYPPSIDPQVMILR